MLRDIMTLLRVQSYIAENEMHDIHDVLCGNVFKVNIRIFFFIAMDFYPQDGEVRFLRKQTAPWLHGVTSADFRYLLQNTQLHLLIENLKHLNIFFGENFSVSCIKAAVEINNA
jgi:hypothetical protein